MIEIDARGLFCPEPLMLTKKAMKANGSEELRVLVDNAAARDNVSSLGVKSKRDVTVVEDGDDYIITIK